MDAIVLAGGLGTRLREAVPDKPKVMAPVNGYPFLKYVLDWLAGHGIGKIILSLGYKADTVTGYFGEAFLGIPLLNIIEKEALGTGGAIVNTIGEAAAEEVLILNGDTWFPVDINKFSEFHSSGNSQVSIALKALNDFDRYGTVRLQNDVILSFEEKKFCSEGLVNGGIYLVKKDFITSLKMTAPFSFEKEVLEKIAGTGQLRGRIFNEPFIDIGIPDDYQRAQILFRTLQ
jgi:D-glycero-alpha-D-manno-heptose 1-phosphate guanylyltransferase